MGQSRRGSEDPALLAARTVAAEHGRRGASHPQAGGLRGVRPRTEGFLSTVFEPRRRTTAAALRSAVARGEVDPGIDLDFVLDAVAEPIYYRALFGHLPLTDELVEQSVAAVLGAITR
ncbi:TetR-like C-terminal domain-containing protein [Nocardia sp. CY41]|uniref:TetR-like C-terminal domain-containing protein n=1 Tax=Nocardia sp. CY41 TaxID=2608686 RepID=UPI0013596EE7|nr:TetR-like C-terminal domain-containing protein [Nocardia sp. CY41]